MLLFAFFALLAVPPLVSRPEATEQQSEAAGRHPQEKKKVGGLGHNQNSI
jgi:hypothetical protein